MDTPVGCTNCYISFGKYVGNMYEESSNYSCSLTVIPLLGINHMEITVNKSVLHKEVQ